MNRSNLMLVALVIVGIGMALGHSAMAQTRLGIHVTQEELNIWRQRMTNGPYRVAGDVRPNSPGDWTQIISRKNTFNNNPAADRWAGNTKSPVSCWTPSDGGPNPPDLQEEMVAAGFYALVANDRAIAVKVKDEVLWHATQAGLNFADTTRWCYGPPDYLAGGAMFQALTYLNKVLFAYDYINAGDTVNWSGNPVISSANRTTIETWLLNAGMFWSNATDSHRESRFVNRYNTDFDAGHALTAYSLSLTGNPRVAYLNGALIVDLQKHWNNRVQALPFFYASVGAHLNNTFLMTRAKLFIKEWIRFGTLTNGTITDFERWDTCCPTLGLAYSMGPLAQALAIADMLGRRGDMELFTWTTTKSSIWNGSWDENRIGPERGLLYILKEHFKYIDHTYLRYGTNNPANATSNYLIDSIDEIDGVARQPDVWSAIGNLYYRDAYVKSIYMRTAPGQNGYVLPGYSSQGSNTNTWGGPAGYYPGNLFMFGQMEGKVWPYPSDPTTLAAPTNLRLVTSGE